MNHMDFTFEEEDRDRLMSRVRDLINANKELRTFERQCLKRNTLLCNLLHQSISTLNIVWDSCEMGWIQVAGSAIYECGECGAERWQGKHRKDCLQGKVNAALSAINKALGNKS